MTYRSQPPRRRKTPAASLCDWASSVRRTSGSARRARLSAGGSRITSPQPGMSQRAQNVPKLMFMGTSTGMVSATTRPPWAAAASAASSWRGTRSGAAESTVRTFQLIDRPAAAVAVARRQRGRKAQPAGVDRPVEQPDHHLELGGCGLVADRVGAHHVAAQRAVPDHEPGVEADPAVDTAEVVGECLPLPVDAVLERV